MGTVVAELRFTDADYALTAASFDNPDFVDVVIQSYRHRYGNAPGDPAYDAQRGEAGSTTAHHPADNRPAW
jgi:hypothetical protein